MKKPKFDYGDIVRIIDYGHLVWIPGEDGCAVHRDLLPHLVGKTGKVVNVQSQGSNHQYSLQGPSKSGWYSEDQLELVTAKNNTSESNQTADGAHGSNHDPQ